MISVRRPRRLRHHRPPPTSRAEAEARAARAEEATLDAELRLVRGEARSLAMPAEEGEWTAESIVDDVLGVAFQ